MSDFDETKSTVSTFDSTEIENDLPDTKWQLQALEKKYRELIRQLINKTNLTDHQDDCNNEQVAKRQIFTSLGPDELKAKLLDKLCRVQVKLNAVIERESFSMEPNQSNVGFHSVSCYGHKFVDASSMQTPGYMSSLSPYLKSAIFSRLLSMPSNLLLSAAGYAETLFPITGAITSGLSGRSSPPISQSVPSRPSLTKASSFTIGSKHDLHSATLQLVNTICDCCTRRIHTGPLSSLASMMRPIVSTSNVLMCEHCLYQVHEDCFEQATGATISRRPSTGSLRYPNRMASYIKACPSILFDRLGLLNQRFVPADQVIESQDKLRSESADCDGIHDGDGPSRLPTKFVSDLLILDICPETGLHSQGFACADCNTPIRLATSRLCHYDGKYYCYRCHTGDELSPLPARIVRNWDFTPAPVSRSSWHKLCFIRTRPILFNVSSMNPKLYGFIEGLVNLKRVRENLYSMLKYIRICGQPHRPRLTAVPDHFINDDQLDYYSLNDLINIPQLIDALGQLQSILERHIMRECESCHGKGYYCELCNDKQDVLFPFMASAATCTRCNSAVYHKNCYHRKKKNCPRCTRRKNSMQQANNLDSEANSTARCE